MIVEYYKSNTALQGQRMLAKTMLFDKFYFWMQDIESTIYLLPEVDGQPSFL